ncbi:TAXI family TRAP transporter solute-binding subunit [Natrialbaceae archaeon A-gly3]
MSVAGLPGGAQAQEDYTISMGGSTSGSTAFGSSQALSRALSQESDWLDMSVQTTGGNVANMYLYDEGDLPAVATDNNTIVKALEEDEDFADQPVDDIGYQTLRFNGLDIYWVAVEGSGIESTADFPGNTIFPIQPGFGTRLITQEVMERAGMWDDVDIINVDVGDSPGAIEEGRIDALALYGSNGVELTGWAQEIDARNDVYAVEVDETFEEAIEETPGARHTVIEPYGWDQDVTDVTDEVIAWALDLQFLFSPEIPAEVGYEFARVSHEHADIVQEADPTYQDHSDPEEMVAAMLDDLPVHEGFAEFYQEQDVWDDSWEVGEADSM